MLKERVLAAIAILVPVGILFWIGGIPLLVLGLAAHARVNYELASIALPLKRGPLLGITAVLCLPPVGYLIWGWSGVALGLLLATVLLGCVAVFLLEQTQHALPFDRILPALGLALSYTGLLGVVPIAIVSQPHGRQLLVWLLAIVIASDTFAYFGGRALGRRPLAPRLSPKKTTEGAITGFACALITGITVWHFASIPLSPFSCGALAILIALLAQVGDLVESAVKRVYGVKDAAALIPGHGGLLDRIDALLFACPALLFVAL